jgi:hypothetical protein
LWRQASDFYGECCRLSRVEERRGDAVYTETRHKAKSWHRERRIVARIEATMTSASSSPASMPARPSGSTTACIARGQAEKLIKLDKTQLASDRTSCRSALANQVRLVLHTAA